VGERLKLFGPAQPFPSQQAVAQRTQRFQEALQSLSTPTGQQAQR
jgi:hypothetical protein